LVPENRMQRAGAGDLRSDAGGDWKNEQACHEKTSLGASGGAAWGRVKGCAAAGRGPLTRPRGAAHLRPEVFEARQRHSWEQEQTDTPCFGTWCRRPRFIPRSYTRLSSIPSRSSPPSIVAKSHAISLSDSYPSRQALATPRTSSVTHR
jgi:hypothetical protein